ncbi:MAG: hypothetical protein C4K47_09960 [Candidatus Thorarchaeota archaeon]|nr:MAG: hypothetical protein C4K47_09960 [Candidatus Thorarchaeota archaeon]
MAFSKAMLVARADLKMALQVKYVRLSLIGMGAFGPIIALLLIVLVVASVPLGADYYILMAFFPPMGATLLAMFSVIPATMISANALVGEREQNTLEPILSTPLTDRELLLGKTLSSFIPSIALLLAGTCAVLLGSTIAFVVTGKPWMMIPDVPGLFLILCAAPLVILTAVSVNIIISGKVKRVYEAYQSSGMIILVLMIPMLVPIVTLEADMPNPNVIWLANLFTFLISIILVTVTWALALKRFNRDTMVSRR